MVDIETTGLSPYRHGITEIAALKVRNHKVVDEFVKFVNPGMHIPSFITRLTGINDKMVAKAKTIDKVIPQFKRFLGKDVFVAHNASFDYKFLNHAAMVNDLEFANDVICTCKMARRILPDLPSKKLGHLCEHYGIINDQAHRAKADALATTEVFSRFIRQLHKQGMQSYEDVLNVQYSKIGSMLV